MSIRAFQIKTVGTKVLQLTINGVKPDEFLQAMEEVNKVFTFHVLEYDGTSGNLQVALIPGNGITYEEVASSVQSSN